MGATGLPTATMDPEFCCAVLSRVLMKAIPEIFNTDQGSQYTARVFIDLQKAHPVRVNMAGRGPRESTEAVT